LQKEKLVNDLKDDELLFFKKCFNQQDNNMIKLQNEIAGKQISLKKFTDQIIVHINKMKNLYAIKILHKDDNGMIEKARIQQRNYFLEEVNSVEKLLGEASKDTGHWSNIHGIFKFFEKFKDKVDGVFNYLNRK